IELAPAEGAAVVAVLRHVRREVRIQRAHASVHHGLHEIADEQIVEDLVAHGSHQRVARRLERDAATARSAEVHEVVATADAEVEELELLTEVLELLEVAAQRLDIIR